MTSDKALVALVASLVSLGAMFGLEVPEVLTTTDYVAAIALIANPILVWLRRNKPKAKTL